LNYLVISSELLGKDCWDSNYETTFAITLNLAECELLTRQLRAADERLSRLSTLAANHGDRAAVTSLREMLYTTTRQSARSLLSSTGTIPDLRRSLEDMLVRDADKLWRFTPAGIGIACDWFNRMPSSQATDLMDHVLSELHTEAGLRIARQDLAYSRRLLQIGLL
jgi:hypothetical protein